MWVAVLREVETSQSSLDVDGGGSVGRGLWGLGRTWYGSGLDVGGEVGLWERRVSGVSGFTAEPVYTGGSTDRFREWLGVSFV